MNYIKSFRFFADSGAVLGTGVVTQYIPIFKVFGIFKMTRVLRLGTFISRLNIPLDVKSLLKLLKVTFYLYLWIHSIACVWHIICQINAEAVDRDGRVLMWYPPNDWVDFTETTLLTNESNTFYKYSTQLYYGVLMLMCNEMGPVNDVEMLMSALLILLSKLLSAQFFGEIAVSIFEMQKKQTLYQLKIDDANSVLTNFDIPFQTQEDIRSFIQCTADQSDLQEEFNDFLNLISPSLKMKVQQELFKNSLLLNKVICKVIGNFYLQKIIKERESDKPESFTERYLKNVNIPCVKKKKK